MAVTVTGMAASPSAGHRLPPATLAEETQARCAWPMKSPGRLPYIPLMRHEVHGLRDFYATPAGLVAARLLRDRMRQIWPRLPGQAVLGLGYASPFLRLWRPDVPGGAARCIS